MKALERQIERLEAAHEKSESKRIELEKKTKPPERDKKSDDSETDAKPKIKQ